MEIISRGFRVVIRPHPLKLVQVVGAQDRPVSCQVFKVVHDDGDEQVDDLEKEEINVSCVFLLYQSQNCIFGFGRR